MHGTQLVPREECGLGVPVANSQECPTLLAAGPPARDPHDGGAAKRVRSRSLGRHSTLTVVAER
jgi:hypothetical protein